MVTDCLLLSLQISSAFCSKASTSNSENSCPSLENTATNHQTNHQITAEIYAREWLLGSGEKCVRESTCTDSCKYLEYPSPIGQNFVRIEYEIRVNLRLSHESIHWLPKSWFEFISISTISVYSFSSSWDSDHRLIHPSWLCWIWALVKSQSHEWHQSQCCKVRTCQCKAWKLRRNPRYATSISKQKYILLPAGHTSRLYQWQWNLAFDGIYGASALTGEEAGLPASNGHGTNT